MNHHESLQPGSPASLEQAKNPVLRLKWLRIVVLSLLVGFPVTVAAPAWAHDALIDSNPEPDEVLSQPLDEVVLEFSGSGLTTGESINNVIQVLDADQRNWAAEAVIDGATASTDIVEELPDGRYDLIYRVVYSDGHVEEDSFTFEMQADSEPAETDNNSETAEPEETENSNVNADNETNSAQANEVSGQATASNAASPWVLWAAVVVAIAVLVVGAFIFLRPRKSHLGAQGEAPTPQSDTSPSDRASSNQGDARK